MSVDRRTAIIDIGSNSVRLVVYGGPTRAPVPLFNEKLLAGLGRDLQKTGRLGAKAMANSVAALSRFKHLTELMQVPLVRVVATAAVRDASNGADFVKMVSDIGLEVEILSGEAEARASGYGVIASAPDADGIVGDLGGGSLELVRVKDGLVFDRASFPIGTLRIAALRSPDPRTFERYVRKLLKPHAWLRAANDLPFYMVGGSWRSLARFHIFKTKYPLPVISNYVMPPKAATQILRMVATLDKVTVKQVPTMSSARVPMLNDAAALLSVLTKVLKPKSLVACAFGLREGLLFETLSPDQRAEDPIIVGARFECERQGRFGAHGDELFHWISPLFPGNGAGDARLRHAACLLADIAWAANPEFRSEYGLEMALHGNWIGVNARERAMLGMAVYASLGGISPGPAILSKLASPDDLSAARLWGLAIRLGQRIGGGTGEALHQCNLRRTENIIWLAFDSSCVDLKGEAVFRRLKQLANAMGCTAEMV